MTFNPLRSGLILQQQLIQRRLGRELDAQNKRQSRQVYFTRTVGGGLAETRDGLVSTTTSVAGEQALIEVANDR